MTTPHNETAPAASRLPALRLHAGNHTKLEKKESLALLQPPVPCGKKLVSPPVAKYKP